LPFLTQTFDSGHDWRVLAARAAIFSGKTPVFGRKWDQSLIAARLDHGRKSSAD
jgi:hypothetical protein